MALVQFKVGSYASYAALPTKDANTLYFINDKYIIYKGDKPYTQGVEFLSDSSRPEQPAEGIIYVYPNYKAEMYVGEQWKTVNPGVATAIETENDTLVTAKLLKDFVDKKVSSVYRAKGTVDNFAALEKISDAVEGDVYNVKDTGDNYVWIKDTEHPTGFWDKLSGIVNLDDYYNKSEVDQKIQQQSQALNTHKQDKTLHVSQEERQQWNAKATTQQVETAKTEAIAAANKYTDTKITWNTIE